MSKILRATTADSNPRWVPLSLAIPVVWTECPRIATVDETQQRKGSKIAAFLAMFGRSASMLGPLSFDERCFIDSELFRQAERFIELQGIAETFLPYDIERPAVVEHDSRAQAKWYRWYWRTLAKIEAKVLVRRKGTVRSGSSNGAQVCCTHIIAIYPSDATARWIIGMRQVFNKGVCAARNWFDQIVSIGALGSNRRLRNETNFQLCAA